MATEEVDFLLKLVLVGDSGVGKTNLLNRFSKNRFDPNSRNTIGVDFCAVDLQIKDKKVRVQFWDTAGQEKYRAISSAYYKNAHGAIIVYDITSRETFENVDNWINELKEHCDKNVKVVIVGNKNDLTEERQVLTVDGQKLAKKRGFYFFETSAKVDEQNTVHKAFTRVIEEIITSLQNEETTATEQDLISLKSKTEIHDNNPAQNRQDKGCC